MRTLKTNIVFILCIVIASCTNLKDDVLKDFTSIYTSHVQFDSNFSTDKLSGSSLDFIKTLTEVDQKDFESIFELGKKYKVPHTICHYFTQINNSNLSFENDDFIKFLSNDGVSILSFNDIYNANRELTKTENEYVYVAVVRNSFGDKKLDWVRLIKENEAFKLDLLYLMQLHEKRKMKELMTLVNNSFDSSLENYLSFIFHKEQFQVLSDSEFERLKESRLSRFKKEFSIN